MRTVLALPLLLGAALAASAQEMSIPFDDLIVKMSEGRKRNFTYDQTVPEFFSSRKVSGGLVGLDGDRPYEAGLEILRTAGLAAFVLESGTVRIVRRDQAMKETLRVVSSTEELPAGDEFLSLTISPKHARARDLLPVLQALISDPRNVLASESTNSIILSDHASNLRKVAEIVKKIDGRQAAVTCRFTVTILEGSADGEAFVPAGFEGANLVASTGLRRFTVVGQGLATLSMGGAGLDPAGYAMVSLSGGEKLSASLKTSQSAEGGVMLEQLQVTAAAPEGKPGEILLQTRIGLRDASWVIAGSIPAANGSVRLVLVRVDEAK